MAKRKKSKTTEVVSNTTAIVTNTEPIKPVETLKDAVYEGLKTAIQIGIPTATTGGILLGLKVAEDKVLGEPVTGVEPNRSGDMF